MSVKPADLDNQERGLDVARRDSGVKPRKQEETAERRALRARLDQARELKPTVLHWWECWRQGKDAAVAAIEADGDTSRARVLPAPGGIGCRDCFQKGRDAVVGFIEGG